MDIKTAGQMLDSIKELAASGDYGAAHALEDTLHLEALVLIASGEMKLSQAVVLAALAASSNDIPFSRVAA